MRAFQQLVNIPIPPVLHFPVLINGARRFASDASQMQPPVDNSLAIVPAQPPYLHTVVLRVWAHMPDVLQAPLQHPMTEDSVPAKRCLEPFQDATSLDDSISSQGSKQTVTPQVFN
jgi:hypothetical protein